MTPANGEPFGPPKGEVVERPDRGHRSGEQAGGRSRPEALPGPTAPPAADGRLVLRALRFHWFLVLTLGTFTASALAATSWFCFPSKYTTYSLLKVSGATPSVLPEPGKGFYSNEFVTYLKTQASLIRSSLVLTAALGDPAIAQLPTIRRQEDPVRWLEEELKVETQSDSMILKIALSGDNPNDITQIVNAVRRAYLRDIVLKEAIDKKNQLTSLEDTRARVKTAYELRYKDYLSRHSEAGLVPEAPTKGLTPAERLAMSDYTASTTALAGVRADKARYELELQALTTRPQPTDALLLSLPGSPDLPPAPNSPEEHNQKEYEQRLARTKEQLAHKEEMVPNPQTHPEVVSLRTGLERMEKDQAAKQVTARKEFLARARARIKVEQDALTARLRTEIALLAQREQKLTAAVQALADKLGPNGGGLDPAHVERTVMQSELSKQKDILDTLDKEVERLRIEVNSPARVTLVQKATVPIQKEMKKQIGLTVASALAGLILIALCVTLYETAVGRVFGSPDLETAVRAPILATLPAPPRRSRGGRPNPAENDRFGDAVDTLRTVLQKRLLTRHGQSVLVASAAASEGKSTVALHLALSLAQTSRRVLLIDGDFRTPKLHAWVDAAPAPGLGEALVNERRLTEVLTRTAVPGLWFMPAGTWNAKLRQCLSQGQLRTMLTRLKEDYDYLVIDSHAVLATLDTPLLAQHTDAVLFAVQKHGSRLAQVRKALQRLAEVGARKVGLVLVGEV